MAKVFTITPGLENMGALKTGGQGSVYKGRRIGEIITAIKLLPTPIYSESADNKNYRDFTNEVEKLKRVNEDPNPNVVNILSSGLSETGNFPYIEMDYIEGPDLEELLQPPHEPVFSIKEVIKVAEHLANALSHCHRKGVKHGDIKSNNVKFNIHTGNYILLDFGLAVMSEEQRRTSLRQAGAIEFMAPEQNDGRMLFETDIYSYGIVLFELLTGNVPFPLQDKSEHARNHTRLAHLETPPADVVTKRAVAIPTNWIQEKRDREMVVPGWLVKLVYKCLEKKPASRFSNGMELYEYVIYHGAHAAAEGLIGAAPGELSTLSKEQLQQHVLQYRQQLTKREKELDNLKATFLAQNNNAASGLQSVDDIPAAVEKRLGVSSAMFTMLLLLTIALGGFSAYAYYKYMRHEKVKIAAVPVANNASDQPVGESNNESSLPRDTVEQLPKKKKVAEAIVPVDTVADNSLAPGNNKNNQPNDTQNSSGDDNTQPGPETTQPGKTINKFQVVAGKAYFYNEPDEATKRGAYMVPSDKAVLTATDDLNGFVYVTFTNQLGQTSKGWLKKTDLKSVSE